MEEFPHEDTDTYVRAIHYTRDFFEEKLKRMFMFYHIPRNNYESTLIISKLHYIKLNGWTINSMFPLLSKVLPTCFAEDDMCIHVISTMLALLFYTLLFFTSLTLFSFSLSFSFSFLFLFLLSCPNISLNIYFLFFICRKIEEMVNFHRDFSRYGNSKHRNLLRRIEFVWDVKSKFGFNKIHAI